MDIKEAKKKIREIEIERNRLANERDELQSIINKERREKEAEFRKGMLGRCYYSRVGNKLPKYGRTYEGLIAFRVDKISVLHNFMECTCVLKSDFGDYLYLDKMSINPFMSDCRMMAVPKDCPTVLDSFEEIYEDEFNVLCEDVIKRLMEKK